MNPEAGLVLNLIPPVNDNRVGYQFWSVNLSFNFILYQINICHLGIRDVTTKSYCTGTALRWSALTLDGL